jgi:hypothetical protein
MNLPIGWRATLTFLCHSVGSALLEWHFYWVIPWRII